MILKMAASNLSAQQLAYTQYRGQHFKRALMAEPHALIAAQLAIN
jgi:hypothetical protein